MMRGQARDGAGKSFRGKVGIWRDSFLASILNFIKELD